MFDIRELLLPLLLTVVAGPALASDAGSVVADAPPSERCACTVIPALTPVTIEILVPLGSTISKTGDGFPIRLASPIVIDGKEVVPVGASGIGEVIHAKKGSGMGAAGELVLAARYLEVDRRMLTLRSMNFASSGKTNIDVVNTINAASAASPIPIGLIGLFISGGQVSVPGGTIAQAKTRSSFMVPQPAAAPTTSERAEAN